MNFESGPLNNANTAETGIDAQFISPDETIADLSGMETITQEQLDSNPSMAEKLKQQVKSVGNWLLGMGAAAVAYGLSEADLENIRANVSSSGSGMGEAALTVGAILLVAGGARKAYEGWQKERAQKLG